VTWNFNRVTKRLHSETIVSINGHAGDYDALPRQRRASGGNTMLRKLTLIFAILGALMIPDAAIAKHGGGGHHGGGHHGGGHHGGGHRGGSHHAAPHRGGHRGSVHHGRSHYRGGSHHGKSHHVYRGHGSNKHWNRGIYRRGYGWGRWYHGVWWAYGVGSCWRLVPGGWVWVCY
jgi:hypothetical protein